MKRLWVAGLAVLGCGGLGLWVIHSLIRSASSESTQAAATPAAISKPPQPADLPKYQRYDLPNSEVHTVTIGPQSRFRVSIALSPTVETIGEFAKSQGATASLPIAVLNGGFFDPKNQKTTSYVIQTGKVISDPQQNDQLMQNPDLKPYLPMILKRSEFRTYQCGEKIAAAIAVRSDLVPAGCRLLDSIGAGPQLLPKLTAAEEGFVDEATGRDAIGMNQRNARSAIGIKRDGSIVFVMAAQKPDAPGNSGMSVQAMVSFMQRLGVEQALNLDGGSSSALVYQDQTFYGKVDKAGQPVSRAIKSAIVVHE